MEHARIEVRDKEGIYDAVAEGLKTEINDIGIKGVKDVEYIQVYTLAGDFSAGELRKIALDILTDKISQECDFTGGYVPRGGKHHIVEIAYNPGVMDPVEESAMKSIRDIGVAGITSVRTSKKYIISGTVSPRNVRTITESLLYNKIIQHVVTEKEREKDIKPYEFSEVTVDMLGLDDKGLLELSREGQLYLNLLEMRAIQEHFRRIGRNPTDCELETIAQTWSEHCKHKTMMGSIRYNGKMIKNLLKDTVMRVTRELDRSWCVSVFKDNAGIIRFDGKNDICFKVETHNHPSALEPYGGSETGIGGVLRDPMGTGRGAKPIINTDVFCFGMPDMKRSSVPKGALHPKRVMKGVVSGVRDYGNKMGIPTVNGAVCYDARYTGNPLVFCGNVGILPHKFSTKKVSTGDLIVVVGGKTGRDGIHGATFSSAELTSESETISSTAVQIGNPITEKKVLDTLIKARDMGLYEAITDCGAGGFSSAVGEMGEETGAEVHLDKAPLKYKGLKPWEIWVSEAQERMVLAVRPRKLKALMKVFESEDVEATVIGRFTDTKKLKLCYRGHTVADIDMSFIHDGIPRLIRNAVWKPRKAAPASASPEKKDYTRDLVKILSSWNVCSKEWVIRQYDHEVQGGSVLKPLVGRNNDGPSDASVTKPLFDSNKGIALSNGINPLYGDIDPYWMAASAIDESMRQLVSVGCDPSRIALLDNFCWGNTDNPEQLGALVRASKACYDMASVFGTPFISGKDSLNNEFNTGKGRVAIPYTLLISAIGVVNDVRKTISMDVKEPGNDLYIVGKTFNEMGGSHFHLVNRRKGGDVPRVEPKRAMKAMERLYTAITDGLVVSCHDCSEGGMAVALSEMLFAGAYGADVSLSGMPRGSGAGRDDVLLFSESNSRFIVEVPSGRGKEFEHLMKDAPVGFLGTTRADDRLTIKGLGGRSVVKSGLDPLRSAWKGPLKRLMHEKN
ncbi:MAG: phosphoribosylformylglycinamidine synthase subunit PurL [Candidatus Omnitrophica bacterium]|nr:phosphoribosylformylglycinamidine synthase subunit PurL [Candidatus Omnitrophota bacterium]MDD5487996.1 phosphoribosylformylglycinamidine synthase subunit PurL [Candidatus Omnitrophota bacterium]